MGKNADSFFAPGRAFSSSKFRSHFVSFSKNSFVNIIFYLPTKQAANLRLHHHVPALGHLHGKSGQRRRLGALTHEWQVREARTPLALHRARFEVECLHGARERAGQGPEPGPREEQDLCRTALWNGSRQYTSALAQSTGGSARAVLWAEQTTQPSSVSLPLRILPSRGSPRCEHLFETAKMSPANSWINIFCSAIGERTTSAKWVSGTGRKKRKRYRY